MAAGRPQSSILLTSFQSRPAVVHNQEEKKHKAHETLRKEPCKLYKLGEGAACKSSTDFWGRPWEEKEAGKFPDHHPSPPGITFIAHRGSELHIGQPPSATSVFFFFLFLLKETSQKTLRERHP
eukprot:scpid67712/ scgid5904/ 